MPFLVPLAGVTESNKKFSFLEPTHSLNCCWEPSGMWFLTTTIGLAHWEMLLGIIPASDKFSISCFNKIVMFKG